MVRSPVVFSDCVEGDRQRDVDIDNLASIEERSVSRAIDLGFPLDIREISGIPPP
jgi:hypothetical protein